MTKQKTERNETQHLVGRIRNALPGVELVEKRMFGGATLMLNGNMLCCADKKGLMVRVGKEAEKEALQLPHAHPCDWSSRKMPGFIVIDPDGISRDDDLAVAVTMALRYVSALLPKASRPNATLRRLKHRSIKQSGLQ